MWKIIYRLVIIDGNEFSKNPKLPLTLIENKLFSNGKSTQFYNQKGRFQLRTDGHYESLYCFVEIIP